MKYTVIWSPRAEQLLAEVWLQSSNRDAVAQAAKAIDRGLEGRALDIGESRESGRRICFEPPLGAVYSIRPERNLVRVLRVWEIKRHRA